MEPATELHVRPSKLCAECQTEIRKEKFMRIERRSEANAKSMRRRGRGVGAELRRKARDSDAVICGSDTEKVRIPTSFLLVKLWTSQKIYFS